MGEILYAHPMPEVIGLIPAAGRGTRLPGRECSKEVLPLPESLRRQGLRVAADPLLWGFGRAGIRRALVLLRPGKEDVPRRLGSRRFGVELTYREVGETRSVVETLAAAVPAASGAIVALGFPDVLLRPADGFDALLRRLEEGSAAAVLGLYPNDRPARSDIVELADANAVRRISVKSSRPAPGLAWMTAVWRPPVSAFLAEHVARYGPRAPGEDGGERERQPGDVLNAALADGLRIDAVAFADGASLDIGTPGDLERAAPFDFGLEEAADAGGRNDTD